MAPKDAWGGPDDVSADQHKQPGADVRRPLRLPGASGPPAGGQVPPVRGRLGAASGGRRADLPGHLLEADGERCVLVGSTRNPAMYVQEWLASIPFAFHVEEGEELRAALAELAGRLGAAAAATDTIATDAAVTDTTVRDVR